MHVYSDADQEKYQPSKRSAYDFFPSLDEPFSVHRNTQTAKGMTHHIQVIETIPLGLIVAEPRVPSTREPQCLIYPFCTFSSSDLFGMGPFTTTSTTNW